MQTRYRRFATLLPYLHPDDGGGSGTGSETATDAESSDDQSDAQSGGEQGGSNESGFKAITNQDDLDRIIRERLGRERKKLVGEVRKDIEAETRAAEAKEQGDFKTLHTELQGKYDTLLADLAARDLKDLKSAAAKKAGIPEDLADRLTGETAEDLEADAKALAKHLAHDTAPNTDSGSRDAGGKGPAKKASTLESFKFGQRR